VAVEIFILGLWIGIAPLTWQRTVSFSDVNGYPIDSSGACQGGVASGAFVVALFLPHAVSLMLAASVAWRVKDLPTEFQESRYVALSIMSIAQIYLIAVPTVVAVYEFPLGRFILMSSVCFFSVLILLGFMFIPKMYLQQYGMEIWASGSKSDSTARLHVKSVPA
jgi:hypothetical protein